MPELKAIIEESYELFKKYRATVPLNACTGCCLTKAEESDLVNLSVRQIPFDLLYEYNTAAKSTNPEIQEFKHFLPRFLELTKDLKFLHHSEELVFSMFDYSHRSQWTDDEITILQKFGSSFFNLCLNVYPLPEQARIDGVLIMLFKTKIELEPILDEWALNSTPKSILHYKDLILYGLKDNNPYLLSSPFANSNLTELVTKWVHSKTVKDKFFDHIEMLLMNQPDEIDENDLSEISWAYDKMKS